MKVCKFLDIKEATEPGSKVEDEEYLDELNENNGTDTYVSEIKRLYEHPVGDKEELSE